MDANLLAMLEAQIGDLARRIKSIIGQEGTSAAKAMFLLSIPGIGPVSAAMVIVEMPELGQMTSAEAAAMTGLLPFRATAAQCGGSGQSLEVGAH